ncbi:MAG: substrate-binding periplasmic protein [Pseudomonas sp.]
MANPSDVFRFEVSSLRVIVRVSLIALGVLLLSIVARGPAVAAQLVRVGAYHFPPYAVKPESRKPEGLLPELLQLFNQAQGDYRFELTATSVARRYRDFQQARFDLILFESPSWGWQNIETGSVDLEIEDAEVYVARAQPGRGQDYFDELKGKRMALYSGYHYGFANFNADQDYLIRQFNAVLTYSHDSNLLMLLRDRADIAVITRSYLQIYQERYPEEGAGLLVSERIDQAYHHHALLRPQAPITPQAFAALLETMRANGQLGQLLGRYHLSLSPSAAGD